MAGEWRDVTLGASADFLSGGTPSKSNPDYWGGDVPWLSAKDMKSFRVCDTEDHVTHIGAENGTKIVPAGTVFLLSRGMTLLNDIPICVARRGMAFNQDVKALRVKPGLREDYLAYLLLSLKPRLLDMVDLAGHGTGRLNTDELKSIRIRIPVEDNEQRAIAHVLGTLDDKIELNRRVKETLEGIARAIFKSWFVDFDPVYAKASGESPESICRRLGVTPELLALFPERLVDSELGEIPEGWEVQSVYSIASVIYGAPFASSKFNANGLGVPLIRIRDLKDEMPGVCTEEVHPKGYMVRAGDIVVGMDGEFRAYLWGGEGAWLNQRVCVFKPNDGYSAAFVHNSVVPCLAHVEETETATTVIHLGKNDIDRFKVVTPGKEVLAAFNSLATPIYDHIIVGKQEIRTLTWLRDTLLPKLLSGELRVPVKEAA